MQVKLNIKNIITIIENQKNNFNTWLFGFFGIVLLRFFIEIFLDNIPIKEGFIYLVFFVNDFLLVMFVYSVFLIFLMFLIKKEFNKSKNFLFYGVWLILLPPIIDKIIFKEGIYKNFYLFDSAKGLIERFFLFYGDSLNWGITIGGRVLVFLSVFLLSCYYFQKKRKILKTVGFAFLVYFIFFILNSLPSLITFGLEFIKNGNILNVSKTTVVGYFMSPLSIFGINNNEIETFLAKKMSIIYYLMIFVNINLIYFLKNKKKYIVLIRNVRLPQVFFNLGLLFLGLALGFLNYNENFQFNFFNISSVLVLCIVVFCSWVSSVLVNDISDLVVDKISNSSRPLITKKITIKEYKKINIIIALFSIVGAFLIKPLFVVFVSLYYCLTWFYSCSPFRFKRILIISNILIAFSSLLFLVMGFIVFSGSETLEFFPWKIYWFLFFAYFFIIPLKDLKDLEGDQKDKIYNLVVLVGRKKTRLIIASFLFSFYLLSVYILHEQELFLSALFFGILNFIIVSGDKIGEKKINSWVLGLVFIYSLWIIKVIFL